MKKLYVIPVIFILTLTGCTNKNSDTTSSESTTDTSESTPIPEDKDYYFGGEEYLGRQYYLNHIGDIFSVWQEYQGKGVTVAVIDKAFDAYHEEFYDYNHETSKVLSTSASFTYDGSKVTTSIGVDKVHDLSDSHGTFCAGVVAASRNNKGVIGVAPEANLLLLKVDGKPKSICEAFKYAADKGAKVITISIGSYYNYDGDLVNDGSDLSTVFNDSINYCINKGTVVVSAGGNGGLDNQPNEYTWPGASPNVIGCGGLATNSSGEIWSGSSYNSSKQYQFIDVLAPSENMFNICNYKNGSGKQVLYDGGWNGTSFASPIVAGLAALYFEKYPNKGAKDFESDLYKSCHAITTSSIANKDQLGYGRVDASKLLNINMNRKVKVRASSKWSEMYMYAWNSDLSLNKELSSWPGTKMKKVSEHENEWFEYELNLKDYDSIVFTNGTEKTVDLLASSFSYAGVYVFNTSYQNYKENGLYVGKYRIFE